LKGIGFSAFETSITKTQIFIAIFGLIVGFNGVSALVA
jgi:hypothetical protein